MSYDLVIKNGTVVDGSGLPRYRADVGVRHGRIVTIGRIRERAREVVDAEGQVVTPGFVDGHTHMDAQIFWDPLGTSSCWHGITSVVMGNCGFTLAPCAKENKHLVVRNLQRAEDIPPAAMEAGIEWRWTTFPEFLDCLDSLPKGINYGGYVGHSAVRTYVMGERAFEQAASEDDLKAMEREVRDAIRAGAIGFTTSRSPAHAPPGGRMFAQVHSRSLSALLSFKTQMPFDRLPVWKELRALPLAEQRRRLHDPELRRRLIEASGESDGRRPVGAEAQAADYDWLLVFDTVEGPHRTVAEVARERGQHPAETMIDLALEKDLDLFFLQPVANEAQDYALELMRHPRAVVTFSDSGAHVSQLMDSSLQTHLLYHWVRRKQAFTLEQAIRMLTLVPATLWGFADRGLIREGMAADLVVFDPETIAAEMPEVVDDLPSGARRLVQRTRGIAATVVNGEVLLRDGKHTGALPGRLLRGPVVRRG